MKANRIRDMEKYIVLRGTVSMEELQKAFGISVNTVRRDIAELTRRETVEKIYGGVRARHTGQALTPYEKRRLSSEVEKKRIARAAAGLVRDGDVIYLDSGTTTLLLIDCLKDKKDVTVITNNIGAVERAVPCENLNVIVLPGVLRRETLSTTGSDVVRLMKKYNIHAAFMAATGVSPNGATNSSTQEFDIKQAAVECSEKTYLMVDRNKFGVTGMMTFAPLGSFDAVITDGVPEEYLPLLGGCGLEVIVAEP